MTEPRVSWMYGVEIPLEKQFNTEPDFPPVPKIGATINGVEVLSDDCPKCGAGYMGGHGYYKAYGRCYLCGLGAPTKVERMGKTIDPHQLAGVAPKAPRCHPDKHDWRQTDNWMIDRCEICGEERA